MNLDEIKNLIEKDGGKFIIIEDGRAILTVMSFNDYEKIINGYKNNPFEQADSMIDQEKETKEFDQGLESLEEEEDIDEELEPWQTQEEALLRQGYGRAEENEERYPWQGLGEEVAKKMEREKEETEGAEGGDEEETNKSEERKNFMDMPIQAKDEEAELEDLPVR